MRRMLLATLALSAFAFPAAAFSNGYAYSRAITVAAAVVPSTQVNFPMLVTGTYSYLATFPNQGAIHNTTTLNAQTVPADLIFTSDAAGTVLLNWEIASYTAASGTIEAWVQIPSLSNGTVIYMFYGNLAVTTFQGNATNVWSGYGAAWHLANGVTESLLDSTVNANTLTNAGSTATAGKIDGGAASTAGLYNSNPAGMHSMTSYSYSLWMNPAALPASTCAPLYAGSEFLLNSNGALLGDVYTSSSYRSSNSVTALSTGSWVYLVMSYTSGNYPRLFVNGSEVSYSSTGAGAGTDTPASGLAIGTADYSPGYAQLCNATFDEARIATTALTASWIATEFANQNSPITFYTVGSATSLASAAGASSTAVIM